VLNLEASEETENYYEMDTVQSEYVESSPKTNEETNSVFSESTFEFMEESEFEEAISMVKSSE